MLKYDWLFCGKWQQLDRVCIKRFQIQMEETLISAQPIWPISRSVSECQPLSIESDSQNPSQSIIQQLIASGGPIFKVLPSTPSSQNSNKQLKALELKILTFNRKERSLETLSQKFIQNYQGESEVMLELDKVQAHLDVQRRRIYDIVNIFESLKVVKKASKNKYIWRGLTHAVSTITAIIQSQGEPETFPSKKKEKEKSLLKLAYRFLLLFIHSDQQVITLEQAARVLMQSEENHIQARKKIRRLYDIVNVFRSIGLVERSKVSNKKPGFKWMGLTKLKELILERKACHKQQTKAEEQTKEKESPRQVTDPGNVNDWFSEQEIKLMSSFGMMKEFNQKTFFPEIIQRESSSTYIGYSQDPLHDL